MAHPARLDQVNNLTFDNRHTLGCYHRLDRTREALAVGLNARPPDRGALARVEHSAMDCGAIGGDRHQSAECVDLTRKMAFADPANRWVA